MTDDERPPEVTPSELAEALVRGAALIDVREADEYAEGHVPSALHIPLNDVAGRIAEIPTDVQVYVICAVGGRSLTAASVLRRTGIDAISVAGGTNLWASEGREIVSGC